ncbi:MAG: N-6 DNA methylase, partial [Coriobacteriia bacterium]|nr:N-6 DNA methylase [Coriobacteriia bacterium]
MSDSKAINKYFKQVSDAYRLGNVETAYNGPIVSLIEAFGAQARDLSGSRSQAAGENIDILLWHDGQATNETDAFAGIEVKKADGIDSRAKEQIIAETERFGRAVLTDNLAWYFWALNDGVPQQYSGVHLMDLIDGEPKLRKESVELFISLMQDFLLASPTTISSSTKLAEYMAIHAKTIRSVVIGILKTNDNSQPLTDERQRQLPLFAELFSLYNRIKADLQPSLDTQAFADMYAQTLVYGLFIARYNDESPESFDRFEAIGNLRQEGSLLRLFFSHIATSNIEHPTLEATIDKLCDLYRSVDLRQLLDKDEEKDTIIHFYEDFLTQYDPALKKSLGVYYTPYQVVRYMVRMVDKILVEEFGIEGGLSDNSTIDVELPT